MRAFNRRLLCCLWLLLLPLYVSAQITPERAAEFEAAVKAALTTAKIPGLSVAVLQNGRIVWQGAAGFADIENGVAAKPATVYRLASISKSFTAVLALQQWEAGRLDLDAPVETYVSSWPRKQWSTTCRQLLGHLGGVRHYRVGELDNTKRYTSLTAALEIFRDDPLVHEPGTKYLYSTYGYNLLGAAVETAAGIPFLELLRERVVKPAGLTTLRDDDAWAIIPNRAQGYRRASNGTLLNSALADVSSKIPGGGLCGTAEDLVRFGAAVMDGRLLKPSTLEMMWSPQVMKDGKATTYGLGWVIGKLNGVRTAAHSGAQPRVSTHLLLIPEHRIAVSVMCNLEGTQAPAELARKLAGMLSAPQPNGGQQGLQR